MSQRSPIMFRILSSIISHGVLEISFQNDQKGPPLIATGRKKGPQVTLQLENKQVLKELTLRPELGFPETYMDGRLRLVDTSIDDFIIFLFLNKIQLSKTRFGKMMGGICHVSAFFNGAIKKRAAKANVAHHYDLTDTLYALFLDERRQYSCAYYRTEDDTLDQAQRQKIARLGAKLRLKKDSHILDIGCGWGELAFGLSTLEKGLQVHGITLSENQFDYATNHVAKRPDKPSISFALQDYRDEQGRYDNIISVGMLEHVGRKSFDAYFKMVDRCLLDEGTAVIHTIGKRRACPVTSPFITKYIFPGGYIPTLADLSKSLAKTDLHIADIECMHNHYAETLLAWRTRCVAQKERLIALYDEHFYRMWLFYLVSCEYFFRLDEGVVYQIQLIKTRDTKPSTRDYIAKTEKAYLKKLCQQNSPFGKPPP